MGLYQNITLSHAIFKYYTLLTPFLMSRPQTKTPNIDAPTHSQTQRRFISPNQLKPQTKSPNPKQQQYRSPQPPRTKEDPSNKQDKSKSQASSQAQSRSNTQRDKIGGGNSNHNPPPDGRSSRSKERKDYMTTNLARLTRKKDEKLSSSNVSDRSNPHSTSKGGGKDAPKPQRYIYTFKEEAGKKTAQKEQPNRGKIEKVAQQYAPMPSSIDKVQPSNSSQISPLLPSSIGSKLQRSNILAQPPADPSSELRQNAPSNNTSIAISSKGRQIQVNTVRYQDRKDGKNQSISMKGGSGMGMSMSMSREVTMPQQTITEPLPSPSQGLSFKRIIEQAPRQQYSNPPLSTSNQRQDPSVRIRRLQSQNSILQQQKTHLLEQKYQLQGQRAFLSGKCQELEREVQSLRESLGKINREGQRMASNNQRMFMELEERYNALLQEYRGKVKQASDLSAENAESTRTTQQLSNTLRGLQQENHLLRMQLQKLKKLSQARVLQTKQESQFQLKQLQIKHSHQTRMEAQLQEGFKQLERQLQAKDKELGLKQARIHELEYQLRDRDELEGLLHVKQTETTQLLTQLNKTKELLYRANTTSAQALQKMGLQLKEKEKTIREMTERAEYLQSQSNMQKLSLSAHADLFGGGTPASTQGESSSSSFQELIRSHSAQTNKLRSLLSQKQDQIFHLTTQGEELTQKVRRLQQEIQLNNRTYAVNLANANQVREATELMLKKRIAALQSLRNMQ